MPATITRRLVSLAETADALAVSTRTIRRYIADGQLEAVRLGLKTIRDQNRLDQTIHRVDAKPGRQLAAERLMRNLKKTGQERPILAAPCSLYVPHFTLGSEKPF